MLEGFVREMVYPFRSSLGQPSGTMTMATP